MCRIPQAATRPVPAAPRLRRDTPVGEIVPPPLALHLVVTLPEGVALTQLQELLEGSGVTIQSFIVVAHD